MRSDKLRRRIAWEAARLICAGEESRYQSARFKAARKLSRDWVPAADLPEADEILEQVQIFARWRADGRPSRAAIDRFQAYEDLLWPLADVMQDPRRHPEGDALYHSLQVFDLACQERPYDEEFLSAALLHDVGKAIDPANHIGAGLNALEGHISERVAWFIVHGPEGRRLVDGTLGLRARRRLEASEDFAELKLLYLLDRRGRKVGVKTSKLEEALVYLRELSGEGLG
jgi:hypothetical protein